MFRVLIMLGVLIMLIMLGVLIAGCTSQADRDARADWDALTIDSQAALSGQGSIGIFRDCTRLVADPDRYIKAGIARDSILRQLSSCRHEIPIAVIMHETADAQPDRHNCDLARQAAALLDEGARAQQQGLLTHLDRVCQH